MCTVILRVPAHPGEPVHILAVRDEDPARPWQPLGEWWPEHPGVVGVRDVRAGGAWLAADASARRLAVILNRASPPVPDGMPRISRGGIVLDAVAGRAPEPTAAVPGFNLVTVDPAGTRITTWDGAALRETPVPPGAHMIAHDDLDDPRTARIAAWRDVFARAWDASGRDSGDARKVGERDVGGECAKDVAAPNARGLADWEASWIATLAETARLGPSDERAIIRDNRSHGVPTQSLLLCTASVASDAVEVKYAALARPGVWNEVTLAPPVRPA